MMMTITMNKKTMMVMSMMVATTTMMMTTTSMTTTTPMMMSLSTVAEDDRGCSVFVTSNPPLPVSLPSYSKFGCGSKGQPWVVEVVSGQRLNVTLLDFQFYGPSTALGENVPEAQPGPVRGLLIDRAAGTNLTVQADLTEQRERWIYQSKGNSLEVYLSPSKDQQGWPDAGYEFLFRFEGNYILLTSGGDFS